MTRPNIASPPNTPNWCAGCGDFGIWTAFKEAAEREGWNNSNTVFVAGIGCHGHIINFMKLSGFEGLHGRPIPVAAGIKMANHKLHVFVFTGDGDCLAEGGNHFIHAARRNHDLTIILHDNAIYGLTTGQTSPRSPKGFVSKSTPRGNIDEPLHPLRLALASGATWLGRSYSGDIPSLTDLMVQASHHRGFAVLQILQPCVTFNQEYSHIFFQRNIYRLSRDYDPTNKAAAFNKLLEWGEKKIPVGVLYREATPSHEALIPQLQANALVKRPLRKRNIDSLLSLYR